MSTDPVLHGPGSDAYLRATQPRNSSGRQAPALVAAPTTAADVGAVVREPADAG